jgi:hypothetical protein
MTSFNASKFFHVGFIGAQGQCGAFLGFALRLSRGQLGKVSIGRTIA